MPPDKPPLRIGIIGCGAVAEKHHLPALCHLPSVRVVALANRSPDRLQYLARRFGVATCYRDYQQLLANTEVDAVGILTPSETHTAITLAALDAGKHVLVEKPAALSLEDCDRMIARANETKRIVAVGFNQRYHRLVEHARGLLQRARAGIIEMVQSRATTNWYRKARLTEWRLDSRRGGGIVFSAGLHHIDLWHFLLDDTVIEVYALHRARLTDHDMLVVSARMRSGCLVSAAFSLSTSITSEIDMYGTHGSVHLSLSRADGLSFLRTAQASNSLLYRVQSGDTFFSAMLARLHRRGLVGDYQYSILTQWQRFVAAVHYGQPLASTLHDARRTLHVALGICESIGAARPILLQA